VTLLDATTRDLHRLTLERLRRGRLPGVLAGVVRGGALAWYDGIGSASLDDPATPPGPDDQFLVASNTKTFTAAMVMQLRDEGRLRLEDTLDQHLPGVGRPGLTLRDCLAHASGLQREPRGDVWDTLEFPDRAELLAGAAEAEQVLAPRQRWHYSNLVYSLLGEVVARLDGVEWQVALRRRLLDPLEMRRTTVGFDGRHVDGYYVPPWSDVPVPQPALDLGALDPCAGLASTAEDLARWSGFWAAPVAEVLSPDTVAEMCEPQVLVDRERWTAAMGLGLFLVRSGDRTYAGHTGGMPGHITAVFTDRSSGTGAVVLTSSGTTPDITGFALALADAVTDAEPVLPEPWRPGTSVPAELEPLLGVWWTEGSPFHFSVREGRLEARTPDQPEHVPPAVFEQLRPDVFRTVSGREQGELLRVTRDGTGRVSHLHWASYLVSREPLAFGERPGAR
jgi:CubicO group peptidase (beta-lactamase class C family)